MPKLPKQLPYPFCFEGDRENIPYTANIGNINYNLGYDGTFGSPLDQGGTEVSRRSMNAVLYDTTQNIYAWQTGVPNYWRQYTPGTEQTTQERQVYDKGAVVWYNKITGDDSTATMILSKVNNNTDIPNDGDIEAGTSGWAYVYNDFSPIIITKGARIYKGINDPVMKGFLKLDGREITEEQYLALPADIRDSIVTGGGFNPYYLIDTRTFSGTQVESKSIVITKNDIQPEGTFDFQGCLLTIYKDGRMTYEGRTSVFFSSGRSDIWVDFPIPFIEAPFAECDVYVYPWQGQAIYNPGWQYIQCESIGTEKMKVVYSSGSSAAVHINFKVSGYLTQPFNVIEYITVDAQNVPVIVDIPDPTSVCMYSDKNFPYNGEFSGKGNTKWYYTFEDSTGQGEIFNIVSGVFNTLGTYNKTTNEFRINGEGLASFPMTFALIDPTKPERVDTYDLVQQVLIEDNSTALRFEERVAQNFGYDNMTLKVNESNDLYVNLDTTQTVYDSGSQTLKILDATNTTKGVASFSDNFTVTDGNVDVQTATDTEKGIASFDSDSLIVNAGVVSVPTATDTTKGVASFGEGFTITDGAVALVNAGVSQRGVASFDSQYFQTVDGFVSLSSVFLSNVLDQWIVVSPTTRYIKYYDGRQVLETTFTIPTGGVTNGLLNITFPTGCSFIVTNDIKYTVIPVSFQVTGTNDIYFTAPQYVSNLRLNTAVTTPMQADSVSCVYTKTVTNPTTGIMRLSIEGFWKTLS